MRVGGMLLLNEWRTFLFFHVPCTDNEKNKNAFFVPCNCGGTIDTDQCVSLEFEEVCESEDEDCDSPEDGYEDGTNEVLEE